MTPRKATARRTRLAAVAVAFVAWFELIRLARAFIGSDLTIRLVAENSRRDAPWPYRLAAVWGNAPGSLLLFAAIVTTVGLIGTRRLDRRAPLAVAVLGGVLTGVAVFVGHPFERLDLPAVRGFGLTPILEHPAMAIHPPLLYLGLAATLPAWAQMIGGGSAGAARRWLLAALGLITLAMALGGWWSYAEQGWGGYWAWDPVENGSLAPWLACLVAIHVGERSGRRWMWGVPWALALGGGAIARSGAVRSVHTFAEAPVVGWTLGTLAVTAFAACASSVRDRAVLIDQSVIDEPVIDEPVIDGPSVVADSDDRHRPMDTRAVWTRYPVLIGFGVLAITVIGTVAPLAAKAVHMRRLTIGGEFFARLIAPLALAAVVALAALLLSGHRRLAPTAAWIAHAGFVVLSVGIVATTFDRSADATLGEGETVTIAGLAVTNRGVTVRRGPREGTDEVAVVLDVGGHTMTPALTAYPERGGVLAETALVSRPWRDIQAVLLDADDSGRAVVEVRSKPFVQLIWLGALLVAVGTFTARRRPSGRGRPAVLASTPMEASHHAQ